MATLLKTFRFPGLVNPRGAAKEVLGSNAFVHRGFASSPTQCSSSRLYELRMYTIQPKHFGPTLQLFEKHAQLRIQYSKLFGYWTAEIGGGTPTQFVHIWEYDSLSHRRQVRNQLAGDDEWKSKFLSTLLANLDTWQNVLMVASPDTGIDVNFEKNDSATYLLQTASKTERQRNAADDNDGHLVGKFQGIMGQTNVEYSLLRFTDVDAAAACATNRADGADGSIMLLYPTSFSPLH